jgi:methionine aminotransferase
MKHNLQQSIFTHMNDLALRYGAVNLGQGFPDHNPPPELIEAVRQSLETPSFQYFPSFGLPALRNAVSNAFARDWSVELDPESEITITAGATQGLADAFRSIAGVGEDIVLVDPSYDSYAPVIDSIGARCIRVPMGYGVQTGFRMDWDRIEQCLSKQTKILVLNNPHNPSGYLMNSKDYQILEGIMEKYPRLYLLGDEVYAHIVFDAPFCTFLKMTAFRDRILVVHSFGKTYHCTGWKLGFVAGSSSWMKMFRKSHEFNVFCVNSMLQKAFSEFLPEDISHHQIASFYQGQRDLMISRIEEGPFRAIPVQSTYFQWIDYGDWLRRQDGAYQGHSDLQQAEQWAKEAGVAMIPFSPFVGPKSDWNYPLMRLCFAKSTDKINRAFDNIYAYLNFIED